MKKRSITLLALLALLLSLAACSDSVGQTPETCEHDYILEHQTEATYNADGEALYVCRLCGDSYTETIPKLESPVTITVDGLNTTEIEKPPLTTGDMEIPQLSDYRVMFDLTVTNSSDTDLSYVSATIYFRKGETEQPLDLTLEEAIPAGETVKLYDYGIMIYGMGGLPGDNSKFMFVNKDVSYYDSIEVHLNEFH